MTFQFKPDAAAFGTQVLDFIAQGLAATGVAPFQHSAECGFRTAETFDGEGEAIQEISAAFANSTYRGH